MKNKKIITPFHSPSKEIGYWENLKIQSIIPTATDKNLRYYLMEFTADLIADDENYQNYGGRVIWDNVEKVFYNYRLSGSLPYTKSFTSSLGINYYLDITDGYIPITLINYINEVTKRDNLKNFIERMIVDEML